MADTKPRVYQQIEATADYHEPGTYKRLLTFFSDLQLDDDSASSQFLPVSTVPVRSSTKKVKPFVIGILPPAANVTGRLLDRSNSAGIISKEQEQAALGQTNASGDPPTDVSELMAGSGDFRDKAKALLQSYVGLNYGASTRAAYLDLLSPIPPEDAAVQLSLGTQASCAPMARGYLRQLGCTDPELEKHYKNGNAISDVIAIAKRHGAIAYSNNPAEGASSLGPPKPGDIYFLTGEHQHMAVVESVEGDPATGRFIVHDVSGGQQAYDPSTGKTVNAIERSSRIFQQDPETGAWTVDRTDHLGGKRPLAYMMDLSKMAPEPVTPTDQVLPDASTGKWQSDGADKAQDAAKATAKRANTQIPPTVEKLSAAQQAMIRATTQLLNQMANTPPLLLLVNPQSFRVSAEKVIADGDWGRNGPIVEHWGDGQDTIEGSGKIAAFYAIDVNNSTGPGLTRAARQYSLSYQNLMSLFLIYRSNGGLFLEDFFDSKQLKDQLLSVLGSIYIYYDNILYIGSFDTFTMNETDTAPFTLDYSFTFSVRAWFLLDRVSDPRFTYGSGSPTTAAIPISNISATVQDGGQNAALRQSAERQKILQDEETARNISQFGAANVAAAKQTSQAPSGNTLSLGSFRR